MNAQRVVCLSALCFGLTLASQASADGGPSSTLNENGSSYTALFSGQRLISDSGYYHLEMQGDGNLVEYADCGSFNAVWSNGKNGTGGNDVYSPYVAFQQDGNFVEYPWSGGDLWASGHTFGGGGSLRLQDDGNLVDYPYSGGVAWATGTHGTYGNPGCGQTASFTTVWPNWSASNSGYSTGLDYPFDACGNACVEQSQCTAFTWRGNYPFEGYCTLYSAAVPPNWEQSSGSSAAVLTRGVAPSGR